MAETSAASPARPVSASCWSTWSAASSSSSQTRASRERDARRSRRAGGSATASARRSPGATAARGLLAPGDAVRLHARRAELLCLRRGPLRGRSDAQPRAPASKARARARAARRPGGRQRPRELELLLARVERAPEPDLAAVEGEAAGEGARLPLEIARARRSVLRNSGARAPRSASGT